MKKRTYLSSFIAIVRVIIFHKKAASKSSTSAKKSFNALKLKTKGFKFNRDNIYN